MKTPTTLRNTFLGALGAGILAAAALAQPMPSTPTASAAAGKPSTEESGEPGLEQRVMEKRIAHTLEVVGATPEQRKALNAIADAAFVAVRGMRGELRANQLKSRDLMLKATIDRAALEQVRQDELKLHDRISKRIMDSLLEGMSVLTPEQRVIASERRLR